jgi:hypothetical protein
MSQLLVILGASIFAALGIAHGWLTLRDLKHPRAFTPTDKTVRVAMENSRLALNPGANLWKAWMGFNLSHSLGVVVFGAGLLAISIWHYDAFAHSRILQSATVLIAASYFLMAINFWFWAPALGTGISLACFLLSIVLL